MVAVGQNGEKKRATSSHASTACQYLEDMYGNFQPSAIEFDMASEYTIEGISSFSRPSFIKEENFGISDTTIHVKKMSLSGQLNDAYLSMMAVQQKNYLSTNNKIKSVPSAITTE